MATTTATVDRDNPVIVTPEEQIADLERRLEAWLLIKRFMVAGRS